MFMVAQHPGIDFDRAPDLEWWTFWLDDGGRAGGDVRWGEQTRDPSRDDLWDRLGDFA